MISGLLFLRKRRILSAFMIMLIATALHVTDFVTARVEVDEQRAVPRYIITGGPGVGKTTIANFLKKMDGFEAIDEPATRIITRELAEGVEKPWEHPDFTIKILTLQKDDREKAETLEADHLFFDRSPIDTFTYCLYHNETILPEAVNAVENALTYYNSHVFLIENFGECHQTEVRPETIEQAKIIESALEKSYNALGFEVIRVKPGPVEKRVDQILEVLDSIHYN